MPNHKIIAATLSATLFIGACSPANIQPNQADSAPASQDDIMNVLDPNIKTEEQAFAKGEALYESGKAENALFYYIKTLQFNKKNVKALERIATINQQLSHPELANKIYKDILAIDGNNLMANEHLGLYYLENGQNGKAKPHLATVVKQDPNNWKAHNALGVIADLEHNSGEAISHYEDALAIEPTNPMLLNNLGYSHYLAGNPVKAKMLFTQALSYDNKYKRAIHNLALIEIKNGNFSTAAALFNRIMPPHDSYNNVGYISMLNGQYAAAEEYLRRAIDDSPVYFPKAQENLKTLMSLQKSQPYRAGVSEEMAGEPAAENIDESSAAPEEPTTNSQQSALKPEKKTVEKPKTQPKPANKAIAKKPAESDASNQKKTTKTVASKNTDAEKTAAKAANTPAELDSETTPAENQPTKSEITPAGNQPQAVEAKLATTAIEEIPATHESTPKMPVAEASVEQSGTSTATPPNNTASDTQKTSNTDDSSTSASLPAAGNASEENPAKNTIQQPDPKPATSSSKTDEPPDHLPLAQTATDSKSDGSQPSSLLPENQSIPADTSTEIVMPPSAIPPAGSAAPVAEKSEKK